MTPLQELVLGVVARVGVEAAELLIERLTKVTTLEEALAAIRESKAKRLADFKAEALSKRDQ